MTSSRDSSSKRPLDGAEDVARLSPAREMAAERQSRASGKTINREGLRLAWGPSTIEPVGGTAARRERQGNEQSGWSPPAKGSTLVFAQVLVVGEADAFGTLNIGHVREDDYVALFEPVQDLDGVR